MKKLLFLILILCTMHVSNAQTNGDWKLDGHASVRMAGGTGQYMPFWSRTGEDGILPVRSSGLVTAGADISYVRPSGWFFEAGTNLVGALSMRSPLNESPVYGFIDRLYASAGWKMLRVDVGLKPRHGDLGPLSVSGGDILMSGNARNLPGVNLSSDWIYLEKGHWFGIKGNLAHYHLLDNRCTRGAMVHNKSLSIKLALGTKVDLIAGFGHYAQWGGVSYKHGPQASSFKDYIKVFFAKRGDENDMMTDQLNIFGNHIGREWARVVWRADLFTMTFQYDKPFEDNSGMLFKNFPDGVWSLQFAFSDRESLLTDITYEFINTTWQSGPLHDRPATEDEMAGQDPSDPWYGHISLGGRDHYFNNTPYESGWTYFGRTIGLPLLNPDAPDAEGVCHGVTNSRVRGHHVGLAGVLARVPYRLKATYTDNFGAYSNPYQPRKWQLSLAFETVIPKDMIRIPAGLSVGMYADFGKLYQNSAGLTLRLSWNGAWRF